MSKRLIIAKLMILAMALISLPRTQTQTSAAEGSNIKISSYRDDPFVEESAIGRMDASRFGQHDNGRPFLSGNRVTLFEESFVYRANPTTGLLEKFALNPWPKEGRSNENGNFKFADEARFPIHEVERDAEGKPVIRDGVQVWTPRDLHLGHTTAFAASNSAVVAAEFWAGRDIPSTLRILERRHGHVRTQLL